MLAIVLPLSCLQGKADGSVAVPLSDHVRAGDYYMDIRLLGTLRLPTEVLGNIRLGGISDLAWDQDAGLLYALSDTGKLFHMQPSFSGDLLTDIRIVTMRYLKNNKEQPLQGSWSDAEGLAIINGDDGIPDNSQLYISFENKVRIAHYSPDGTWLGDESLPPSLNDVHNYIGGNRSLESIAYHQQWGILTAPEIAQRGQPRAYVNIYSLRGHTSWQYPLYRAPNSSLVALETLPDDSLITLERAFIGLTHPLIISLRRTWLPTPPARLQVEDIAIFDSSQGWLLDNFEGLTRHQGQRFFMISDDNYRILQNTLLVYFELSDVAVDSQ